MIVIKFFVGNKREFVKIYVRRVEEDRDILVYFSLLLVFCYLSLVETYVQIDILNVDCLRSLPLLLLKSSKQFYYNRDVKFKCHVAIYFILFNYIIDVTARNTKLFVRLLFLKFTD